MASAPTDCKLVNNSYTFTKEEMMGHSNCLKLVDTDIDKGLEMYCYNSCDNLSSEIVKRTRGVVFKGDQVVFAGFPYVNEYISKSDNIDDLKNCIDFENFSFFNSYEGTLIRVFHFEDKWYITTHRKLNAFKSKWAGKNSFGECFKTGISEYNTDYDKFFDDLDKNNSYLFLVLNNIENRIVCMPSKSNSVIHVGTIKNGELDLTDDIGIQKPEKLSFSNFDELTEYVDNISYEEY